jgi:hypothetical protein
MELQHPNGMPLPPKPIQAATQEDKQTASTQPANPSQPAADAKEGGSGGPAKAPVKPQQQWNNFFPRSQLPPEQLEYLQRSRM